MLVTLSALIGIEIVLSRFLSISAWNTKIGFSFVPIVIAAMLYGHIAGGIVGALGDFIGAVLFPIGAYFPGFTLTAFFTGMVFGLLLYKGQSIARILTAVLINQCVLSLGLNTLWIAVLYGSPYGALFLTRIVQTVILIAVQTVVIAVIARALPRFKAGLAAA
ncbi:MAG: folate family ECF transporter S component [Mogibacterium sp.]|nr:folate family ECF transporter S component [Mogibacterium sp.]